ncbi:MAG: tyrosine-type recombinase/integrase [Acidimicrobiales bacterium]
MASRRKGKRVTTTEGVRVFGKNANREGSVYRQADGRWCATWWAPGEKRPRKATGKTQQEAIERRTRRREEAGLDLGALRTVGSLAEWWLHNVHKQAVRASSWAKSEDRVRRIQATLGELPVTELDYRVVTEWQAALGRTLAPWTVRHHRQTLAQIVDEAVKMGALVGNPVRAVRPVRIADSAGVALEPDQTRALLAAVGEHRLAAAVAMLFLQGWRVSEVLGLAWEDLDLDAGTARVRRASVYIDGRGQQLGPPKTDGARGEHWLMPTVMTLLARHRYTQAAERAAAPYWETRKYEGEEINLVFTTPTGGLVLRQTIGKLVKQAARTAGIAADLGTHAGRRTVVTTLFVDGQEALEDIAHFVGHARPSTTDGYVKRLGRRPHAVAQRAAAVLDGSVAAGGSAADGVRNQSAELGSNAGSNGPEPSGFTVNEPEQ